MWGHEALERFIRAFPTPDRYVVADVGSGDGLHAQAMRAADLNVMEYDIRQGTEYISTEIVDGELDGVWCCHVAEHIQNLQYFLCKIYRHLDDDGILAITVPPPKHQIVGGHVNLFNPGLLLYRLILAGFDCSEARLGMYGYNISVIVRKKPFDIADLAGLVHDHGDIARLAKYFPFPITGDNFNGDIRENISW